MPIRQISFAKKNKSSVNQIKPNSTSNNLKQYDNLSSVDFLNNEVGNPRDAYQFLNYVADSDFEIIEEESDDKK